MEIYFARTKEKRIIDFEGRLKDLLIQTTINHEAVIVVRNEIIITDDTKISSHDKLLIIPVISGG